MAGSVNRAILTTCLIAGMWNVTALADNIIPVKPPSIPAELLAPPMHVGDIVYLKTGSPALVITEMDEDKGKVLVTWFEKSNRQTAQLPSVTLTLDPGKSGCP